MRLKWFALRIYGMIMLLCGALVSLFIAIAAGIVYLPVKVYYVLTAGSGRNDGGNKNENLEKLLVINKERPGWTPQA